LWLWYAVYLCGCRLAGFCTWHTFISRTSKRYTLCVTS
jgi:hypothetical protein